MDIEETNYYFGLVEQIRGKTNLINPDPYCDEADKIIKKNIDPTFTAPVIAMKSDQIRDRTASQSHIPAHYLRSEEKKNKRLHTYKLNWKEQRSKKEYIKIQEELRKHMDKLLRNQQEIDHMLRRKEEIDLFETPKFLRGKKRA